MSTSTTDSIMLGAGTLYAAACKDITSPFALTDTDKAALVKIGYIESNAKLTAKGNAVYATAAGYGKVKQFKGDKDVSFTTGIISWDLSSVSKFLTGSDYTTATDKSTFTYANTDSAPNVFLRFVHEDETEKKRITIDMYKGVFDGDLALDFNLKSPVSFDYSFKLLAKDNGTKPVYFDIIEEAIA